MVTTKKNDSTAPAPFGFLAATKLGMDYDAASAKAAREAADADAVQRKQDHADAWSFRRMREREVFDPEKDSPELKLAKERYKWLGEALDGLRYESEDPGQLSPEALKIFGATVRKLAKFPAPAKFVRHQPTTERDTLMTVLQFFLRSADAVIDAMDGNVSPRTMVRLRANTVLLEQTRAAFQGDTASGGRWDLAAKLVKAVLGENIKAAHLQRAEARRKTRTKNIRFIVEAVGKKVREPKELEALELGLIDLATKAKKRRG